MSASIYEGYLATAEGIALFDDRALVANMLRFEAALAQAQADERLIPGKAAAAIAAACRTELYDPALLTAQARRAGSLAIPLIDALRRQVALTDAESAGRVHLGSTSQDVLDTAMVLAIGRILALIDRDVAKLVDALLKLGRAHASTPILGRTLMQPAQVVTLGLKALNWAAPLIRSQESLRTVAGRALALQLGGAVGTLTELGPKADSMVRRTAAALGLAVAPVPWHTQRDELMRLAAEVAILVGSLGKIATDLALHGQAEVGELAEPAEPGRGGSSAMPHKRNPVSSMVALAAAHRAPARLAALVGAMPQEYERALGTWQAELAEWPGLMMPAHAAAAALADAFSGIRIDPARMLRNIEAAGSAAEADLGASAASATALAGRRLGELQAKYESIGAAAWARIK